MKRALLILLSIFIFSSCSGDYSFDIGENSSNGSLSDESSHIDGTSNETDTSVDVDFSKTDEDMFTDRDKRSSYDASECISIRLNGNTASADDESVLISGSTITITKDAPHIITGNLTDGMIIIDAPDSAKLQIVLNGVNITSSASAALYVLEADKVFVTLAENSENILTNGGAFTAIDENNIDATVFSKQDITFNGKGSLTVNSPAGHGIVGKDDLVITEGSYTINSASHAIEANDSVRITGNTEITADAGKDGIHSENADDASLGFVYISNGTINIESEGDGITAGSYMQIEGGEINVLAGGGNANGTQSSSDNYGDFMGGGMRPGKPGMRPSSVSATSSSDTSATSMKGLKSESSMLISSGELTIDSADDALHSNASLTINGGKLEIASGDDAVHAEETLTITACEMNISTSYEGLEALHVKVKGGNIKLVANDDGINAAGGNDSSGTDGGRDGMFGGHGGPGGGMFANSNGSIVISGGNLYINSSGDGLDANGTLEITGGYTVVVGPTYGDTATLDYDVSGIISGGTFIGTGAANMAQSFSQSSQGVIALNVGNQSANTPIVLQSAAGDTLISHSPELSYQIVILSCPEMTSGETYTVTIGSVSNDFTAS